jgi:hypothetical protein
MVGSPKSPFATIGIVFLLVDPCSKRVNSISGSSSNSLVVSLQYTCEGQGMSLKKNEKQRLFTCFGPKSQNSLKFSQKHGTPGVSAVYTETNHQTALASEKGLSHDCISLPIPHVVRRSMVTNRLLKHKRDILAFMLVEKRVFKL